MCFDQDVPGARVALHSAKYLRRKGTATRRSTPRRARFFHLIAIAADVSANCSLTIPTVGFAVYEVEGGDTIKKEKETSALQKERERGRPRESA